MTLAEIVAQAPAPKSPRDEVSAYARDGGRTLKRAWAQHRAGTLHPVGRVIVAVAMPAWVFMRLADGCVALGDFTREGMPNVRAAASDTLSLWFNEQDHREYADAYDARQPTLGYFRRLWRALRGSDSNG